MSYLNRHLLYCLICLPLLGQESRITLQTQVAPNFLRVGQSVPVLISLQATQNSTTLLQPGDQFVVAVELGSTQASLISAVVGGGLEWNVRDFSVVAGEQAGQFRLTYSGVAARVWKDDTIALLMSLNVSNDSQLGRVRVMVPDTVRFDAPGQVLVPVLAANAGISGPAGPQGPVGPQGVAGPVGPQGPMGFGGATGPAGPMGQSGVPGPSGGIGMTGPAGAVGTVGPQGLQGVAGPMGPQGLVGPQGPSGPQGAPGVGTPGAQGPAGTNVISGWEIVTANADVPAFTSTNVTATCPGTKRLLGGGFINFEEFRTTSSGPINNQSWQITVIHSIGGFTLPVSARVICANVL